MKEIGVLSCTGVRSCPQMFWIFFELVVSSILCAFVGSNFAHASVML